LKAKGKDSSPKKLKRKGGRRSGPVTLLKFKVRMALASRKRKEADT